MNHPYSIRAARAIQAQLGIPGIADSLASIIESEAIAPLFAAMPVPPDDMGELEGLEAYAEAIAQWRAECGYPLVYDGPVGPPMAKDNPL